jgi:hypothetical protein
MVRAIFVCPALAALSLLGPSEPSFDPWAWLVWGREVGHLSLDITSGPSWKPLPLLLTTPSGPLAALGEDVPPALWIVAARAGGLLATVLAYRVAAQMAGGSSARRRAAGSVAAGALLLTPEWTRYLIHGSEAPLAVALALAAVDRHLNRSRRAAFILGALVCLARPELFGFLILYAAVVWKRARADRVLVVAAVTSVVAAWLVPPWIAAGDPLSAAGQARSEPSWSLSLEPAPWRAALAVAQDQVLPAAEVLAALCVAASLARRRLPALAPERPAAALALAGFASCMTLLYAVMTEVGFSGNARYVLTAATALAVLAGVGAGVAAELAQRALGARHVGLAAAGACLLAVAATPQLATRVGRVRAETMLSAERSRLHSELERALRAIGPRYAVSFGAPTVNRAFQTHLAWELSLPVSAVHEARGTGLAFKTLEGPLAGPLRIYPRARRRDVIARLGEWTVSRRPPGAGHVYTWPLQRFSLRGAVSRRAAASGSRGSGQAPPPRSPPAGHGSPRPRTGANRFGSRTARSPRPCRSSRDRWPHRCPAPPGRRPGGRPARVRRLRKRPASAPDGRRPGRARGVGLVLTVD